mmetsp:Transcript_13197/g.19781  ORF Transcript_13197/g.19781 Transcript_13197/m.19781 type:complete len:158 (+) Transcript_13197:66-539(+)
MHSSLPSFIPRKSSEPTSQPSTQPSPVPSTGPSESSEPSLTPTAVSNFSGNWGVPIFGRISKFWLKTSIGEADEGTNIGSVEFANGQGTCVDLELVDFVSENEIDFGYSTSQGFVEATLTYSAGTVTLSLTNGQEIGDFTAIGSFLCSPSNSPSVSP